MSKKPLKSKTKSRPKAKPQALPEPAQLRAVTRLMEAEDYAGALRRLEPLVRRFPDHGSLRRSLVEALHRGKGATVAAVAAYEWAEARPGSLAAQEQLLRYAVTGGHVMLADEVAAKVRALGGETRGFPLDEAQKAAVCQTPDGGQAAEGEVLRFDIAKLYMNGYRFEEAASRLEGAELQASRNNRALCLFHLGRAAEALEAFLDAYRQDGDNLFGLGWAALLRLYRGDRDGASGLCTALASGTARRADDAVMPLLALLLMDRPGDATQVYRRAIDSDWWGGIRDTTSATLAHLGACAAARIGDIAEARRLWKAVADGFPDVTPAAENLAAVSSTPASTDANAVPMPAVIELGNAMPIRLLHRLDAEPDQSDALLARLDASDAYLDACYRNGTDRLRQFVRVVVLRRVQHRDADAAGLMREFARLPVGTIRERHGLLRNLRENDMVADDETLEYWDGQQLAQLKLFQIEVHREPSDSGLPPELDRRLEASVLAYGEGRYEDAEAELEAILAVEPNHPVALGNLAAIRDRDGRPDESMRLLQQAVEADPDYLFGRCSLARRYILDGDLETAKPLLAGQDAIRRIHVQDLINLYATQAMLHASQGESDQARNLIRALESVIANDDDAKRVADARRLIMRVASDDMFKQELMREIFDGLKSWR